MGVRMGRADPIRCALVAIALLAPVAWAAPLQATESATADAVADPYEVLYDAIDAVLGSDKEIDRQYREMMNQLRAMPQSVALERRFPGVVNGIGKAMRPWIMKHVERVEARYRPAIVSLMKQELGPEDALKLTAYFGTERGRRFLLDQLPDPGAAQRQPLGQPTAFLKPAEGYTPPAPTVAPSADAPMDPAVAAVVGDPGLKERATAFFFGLDPIMAEMAEIEPDKDITDGLMRDIDYAASTYGVRLFDRPLR